MYKLGGQAQKTGYEGPVIGVKQGTTNKRDFSDDQLKAGQNVIGLQVRKFVFCFLPHACDIFGPRAYSIFRFGYFTPTHNIT